VAIYLDSNMTSTFACPETAKRGHPYAYNMALSGSPKGLIPNPASTAMVLESDAGWNATGGPELLLGEPRHFGGENYGFADGHVQWIKRRKNPDGTWAKQPEADWVIWQFDVCETKRTKEH